MIIPWSPTGLASISYEFLRIDALPFFHQRRILYEWLHLLLEVCTCTRVHVCRYRTRIDSVDGCPFGQFPRPGPGHVLYGGFGTTIHRLANEAEARGDGGKIDDTSGAIVWEVGERRLQQKNWSKDIDVILLVESINSDILQRLVSGYTGVIDYDIDLELASLRM